MAVYRVNKNRGYTVMANYHLQRKVFRRSARKAPMLFWQLSGSLKITATLSVTGNATPRAG